MALTNNGPEPFKAVFPNPFTIAHCFWDQIPLDFHAFIPVVCRKTLFDFWAILVSCGILVF